MKPLPPRIPKSPTCGGTTWDRGQVNASRSVLTICEHMITISHALTSQPLNTQCTRTEFANKVMDFLALG